MFRFLSMADVVERAFGSSLSDILIQIAATVVLVIVVRVFLWSRITEFIAKRKELMEQEFESAKQANEEAKSLQEKTHQEYHDLKVKSKEYLENARQRGELERESIIEKAREDAKEVIAQAEQEIEIEKRKAHSDIRKEAVDLAALMATKIIEKEIDPASYQDLVIEQLESSEKV